MRVLPNLKPKIKAADDEDLATVERLKGSLVEFSSISDAGDAIGSCFGSFSHSKILLIGDGSHGTSEFYRARAEITKYMIENHGYNIVATEADWPDAEAIDRYVRHRPRSDPAAGDSKGGKAVGEEELDEPAFTRFPTWMWRNQEVQDFVEWLRKFNDGTDVHDAVGFYGLDLYSLGTSIKAVISYLDNCDRNMAELARQRYSQLMDWASDPQEYGLESLVSGFNGYETEVIDMLRRLLSKRLEYSALHWDGVEFHSGEQNARVVRGTFAVAKAELLNGILY